MAKYDWLLPQWSAPDNVHAVFTTRSGGVSAAPFDSLNLGDHVRDDSADVQTNRAVVRKHIAAQPVFLQQVHGTDCINLIDHASAPAIAPQADACTTTQPGLACTIMVADCLPVLFANLAGSRVAAAHAGWRGLSAGVLEKAHQQFSMDDDVVAWLGPCIGPESFEVGAEVREAFIAIRPADTQYFVPSSPGKYRANLSGLARSRLHALGVRQIDGNDASQDWCTVQNPSRFFSHRRDATRLGSTGRMAACVWLA